MLKFTSGSQRRMGWGMLVGAALLAGGSVGCDDLGLGDFMSELGGIDSWGWESGYYDPGYTPMPIDSDVFDASVSAFSDYLRS